MDVIRYKEIKIKNIRHLLIAIKIKQNISNKIIPFWTLIRGYLYKVKDQTDIKTLGKYLLLLHQKFHNNWMIANKYLIKTVNNWS